MHSHFLAPFQFVAFFRMVTLHLISITYIAGLRCFSYDLRYCLFHMYIEFILLLSIRMKLLQITIFISVGYNARRFYIFTSSVKHTKYEIGEPHRYDLPSMYEILCPGARLLHFISYERNSILETSNGI
jgi:hypothetical protein